MNRILLCTTLTFATVAPFALHAENYSGNANRFSFGPRFGMNFKAAFGNNPNNPVSNPGPATGGVDHNYDDGYVRRDVSGNAGGVTSNWGYENASQVVGNTLQFHSVQSGSAFASDQKATDDPQYGLEIIYQRVLGDFCESAHWGLELGFGYTDIELGGRRSGGGATVLTDSYSLNGVMPPGPGYNGTFNGPGALIGDTPTRTMGSAFTSSRQKLSGSVFAFRGGPFAEWYITPEFSFAASVGLTLAPSQIDYDFTDTSTFAAGGSSVVTGHSSSTELLYGPYVSAMLRYDFNDNWGIYAGVQFQSLNDLKQSIGSRTAELEQSATLYGTLGVSYRF